MSDRKPLQTGGCQCGSVRYALYAEATEGAICHCRMCQKAVGNYFGAFTGVARTDFAWTKGEPGIFKSSELVERGFCRACGTPLSFGYIDSKRIAVTVGSLDRPDTVQIKVQYGIESRLPAFLALHELPGEESNEGAPPDRVAKLASRQHPDHD